MTVSKKKKEIEAITNNQVGWMGEPEQKKLKKKKV